MNTSDNNSSNNKEQQTMTDLFKAGHQEQPPEHLDDLILQQANNSEHNDSADSPAKQAQSNWRPWLAAASVVFAIPMIWLITQNQSLVERSATIPTEFSEAESKTEAVEATPALESSAFEAELNEAAPAQPPARKLNKPAPATSVADMQAIIEEQGRLSITGKPIDRESLNANKAKLMDELITKKRAINASTMSPLMALEYEQFGRYLERGQIDLADQLLTDMQESWPEYDYEEMIYRLALAETNTGQ